MGRALLPTALVMSLVLAPVCVRADTQLSLKSINVYLPPGDDMFPNGPHADAVNNNCLGCHSADMVLNQPNLTRAAWQEEVMKMIKSYHAPINATVATVAKQGSD